MVNGCGGWRGRQEATFIISPLIYFTTELIKKKRAAYPGREGDARVEQRITLLPSFLSFFASFFSVKSGIPRFDHRLFLLRNYGMPNRCSARLFFSSKSFVAFIFISIFFFFFYFLDTSLID